MKKRIYLMIVCTAVFTIAASSQSLLAFKSDTSNPRTENPETKIPSFEFPAHSIEAEVNGVTAELAGVHPFGQLVAKKRYLLEEKYTSQVALTPGNPAVKTVIKKPVIYQSVKRIERDLKRSVKKGEISEKSATDSLSKVLDVALNIISLDTKEFESALVGCESTESKIELFTKRVILTY